MTTESSSSDGVLSANTSTGDCLNSNTTRHPSLPLLYFHENHRASSSFSPTLSNSAPPAPHSSSSDPFESGLLPSELVTKCLAEYADWGTLARLSCVRSSWKHLVRDAAEHGGREAKWDLATSLLEGTGGLEANPVAAISYLTGLAMGGGDGDGNGADDEVNSDAVHGHGQGPEHVDDIEREESDDDDSPFAPAMRRLADLHFTGVGVPKDNSTGLLWLERAATSGGDLDAAHELALTYEYSRHGVPVDVVAAATWFKTAAEGGHLEAMAEYAMCCELGCGVEQSDEEALSWYVKAANNGHADANFSVGEAFEEARGVPQSDEEACLWYHRAVVAGNCADSKRALQRLRDVARIVLPGGFVSAVLNE